MPQLFTSCAQYCVVVVSTPVINDWPLPTGLVTSGLMPRYHVTVLVLPL